MSLSRHRAEYRLFRQISLDRFWGAFGRSKADTQNQLTLFGRFCYNHGHELDWKIQDLRKWQYQLEHSIDRNKKERITNISDERFLQK